MSHNSKILKYLRAGRSIDPLKALKLFGSWSLSSRIAELKGMSGHKRMLVRGESIDSIPTLGAHGKRYSTYRLRTI